MSNHSSIALTASAQRRLHVPLNLIYSCALLTCLSVAQAQGTEPADEPIELAPIVVSASGMEQKLTDAPASVSVITRQDLAKRPYVTLLDAVRDVEGVDVGETRDKTGQGTISLRGMGSDYTLILVDGKRQNNHGDIYPNSFGGNQFGHLPPLDAIERIEIIRGPASTLYGADAMGGVINIITRKVPKKWGGSVTHGREFQFDRDYGDSHTTDFNIAGPLMDGKVGLALRGSFYDRKASNPTYSSDIDPLGNVVPRSLGFGGGGKTVDNENQALGARLSWALTDKQTVYFDIDRSKQSYDNAIKINDKGEEEYPVGTVDNYGAMLRHTSGQIQPRAGYAPTQEFTRDTWSLTHEGKWDIGNSFVSLSHIATQNQGRTLPFSVNERQGLQTLWNTACTDAGGTIDTGSGHCPLGNSTFNNNWSEAQKLAFMQTHLSSAEYDQLMAYLPRPKRTLESRQYTLDGKLDMPLGDHTVVVGTQIIRGELEDGVFGMESGQVSRVQKHNMFSVFAEDNWAISEPLVLTGGLRYDHHNIFGGHVSPRVYGVYTLNPKWTVKGGIATGFKPPKTTDLYDGIKGFTGQGTSPSYGNPDLKPETSRSQEIAVYWQDPRGHNFNATYFYNTFDDKIANQPCGPGQSQACAAAGDFEDLGYTSGSNRLTNIDKVVIQGLELAGRWQVTSTLGLRANYTWTDSQQKSGINAGLPLGDTAEHMMNASMDWRATDKWSLVLGLQGVKDRYAGQHIITNERLYYKDYFLMNLGTSFRYSDNITFNARINNLLDKDFTKYRTEFRDLNNDGDYVDTNVGSTTGRNETLYYDHYNNKDARRSLWVSMNVKF